eukprot:gene16844-18543_t
MMLRAVLGARRAGLYLVTTQTRKLAQQATPTSQCMTDAFCPISIEELQLTEQIQLRGRKFLPGADKQSFPSFLDGPRNDFPLALRAHGTKNLDDWGKYCRQELDANLVKYGAVLFRQLPLSSVDDFQALFRGIGYPAMNYVGGSAYRESVSSQIYSASDEPPECCIDLHNEMSYSPNYNKRFFFFCLIPPEKGGESVICKNVDLLSKLDERFLEKVERKRLRYIRNCPDQASSNYLSWQTVFETDDKKIAEMRMEKFGFEWKWSDNDKMLTFWYVLDAFAKHHITGKKVWFNQAHSMHSSYYRAHPTYYKLDIPDNMYPLHCTYGDGEELEPEFVQQIRDAGWSSAVGIQWEKGDLIVLDNMLVQHARISFEGKRRILVALAN